MSLVCALSGEVPEHPVVSRISGHVFERRLLEKYIAQNGTDPTNGQPLAEEDLIAVQTKKVIKPRPPNACSIPGLIKMMQDEWDALMLETYQLKKALETTRQELAHSLYQHDAACRVIARLMKERDEARASLASVPQHVVRAANGADEAPQAMEVEQEQEEGIPQATEDSIKERATELQGQRKKRKKQPVEVVAREEVAAYRQAHSFSGTHSASTPGITSLALHPRNPDLILTGGNDKKAVLYDWRKEQIAATFQGHTKKITNVRIHPTENLGFTSSGDGTVKVWGLGGGDSGAVHTYGAHSKEATTVEVHPTGGQLLSAGLDGRWAMHDVQAQRTLATFAAPHDAAIHCARTHPDGLLVGLACDSNLVHIVDIFTGKTMADFPGHEGPVIDMSFSENGYQLATASLDNTVRLWDLRGNKLLNFHTISLGADYGLRAVRFDYSGNFLAIAGKDLRLVVAKQWEEVARLQEHTSTVTDLAFGPAAKYVATTSMDRTLRLWSAAPL